MSKTEEVKEAERGVLQVARELEQAIRDEGIVPNNRVLCNVSNLKIVVARLKIAEREAEKK